MYRWRTAVRADKPRAMFRRFFEYAMDAAVLVAPDFSLFKTSLSSLGTRMSIKIRGKLNTKNIVESLANLRCSIGGAGGISTHDIRRLFRLLVSSRTTE